MTLYELKEKWPILKTIRLEHGPGWYSIIDDVMTAIYKAGFDENRDEIRQIKEKFGTLRFYVVCDASVEDQASVSEPSSANRVQQILTAIKVNDTSGRTCEECGLPGRLLVSAGWWLTRCSDHAPEGAIAPAEYFALRELKNRTSGNGQ
jgi:hypothetical protein